MYTAITQSTVNIVSNIGAVVSSPVQRGVQGAITLGVQPVIDYNNKGTDDNTRAVSTARTIGKIIAGTVVGVAVRAGSIKLIKEMSTPLCEAEIKNLKGFKKLRALFTPIREKLPQDVQKADKNVVQNNYIKVMGTIIGTFAGLFTNFALDVPLTRAITQKTEPKIKTRIDKQNEKKRRVTHGSV